MELGGLIVIILGIMFGPPTLFLIIGISKKNDKPKLAKIFFILAAVYVIVGGGLCASILTGI